MYKILVNINTNKLSSIYISVDAESFMFNQDIYKFFVGTEEECSEYLINNSITTGEEFKLMIKEENV